MAGSGTSNSISENRSSKRRDIQALRAIAVLAVIAFHGQLAVPSGYLGVDVFFAISGFVISGMLVREVSLTGKLKLHHFFLRRVKRLTAPLAFMILAVSLGAALLMSPAGAQKITSETSIGALTLRANIVISAISGGYFDQSAQSNPLLHTWSLAVEEQFYLAFPILIFFCTLAKAQKSVETLVHCLSIVAFGYVIYRLLGIANLPPTSYYSTLNRVWEFAFGASTFLVCSRLSDRRKTLFGLLPALGLIMISVPFMLPPGSILQGLPGQLSAVLGTCLVMASGSKILDSSKNWVANLLVRIGDASYSLYLWHWPAIVFTAIILGSGFTSSCIGAILGTGLGFVAHRLIDEKVQRTGLKPLKHWIPKTLALFAAASLASLFMFQFDMRQQINSAWFSGDLSKYGREIYQSCNDDKSIPAGFECLRSDSRELPSTLILGDSHGEQLFLGLASVTKGSLVSLSTSQPSFHNPNWRELVRYIHKSGNIKRIILSARWAEKLGADYTNDWRKDLTTTVTSLRQEARLLFLVEDVPNFAFSAYDCIAKPLLGRSKCSGEDVQTHGVDYLSQFAQFAELDKSINVVRTRKYFCKSNSCTMSIGGQALYLDSHHLNPNGAKYLARKLAHELGLTQTAQR